MVFRRRNGLLGWQNRPSEHTLVYVLDRTPETCVRHLKAMRFWAAVLVFLTCLHARDDERLALSLRAQSDFERVMLTVSPRLADTSTCAQSEAAILAVSVPEEQAVLHYRKGYCLLAGASITRNRQDYSAAAAEFDRAIDVWPARVRKPVKNTPAEPVSTGLLVLDAIAHLYAENETAAPALATSVSGASCASGFMPESTCRQWVEVGREWLGRIALRAGRVDEAATDFAGARDTGWLDWAQGAQSFRAANYTASATHYSAAIDIWRALWSDPGPGFLRRMGPRPELSAALVDLGGAQLLAGNARQAESTLNSALKADPASARAFYLRGRARESFGNMADALADYNLAARSAFAASEDLASGEAPSPPCSSRPQNRPHRRRCATVLGNMASRSVNKVILLGHLGKDAETKFTPSGVARPRSPSPPIAAGKISRRVNGKKRRTGTTASSGARRT